MKSCANIQLFWEDFYKPKIIYSEIVREPQFYLDKTGTFIPEASVFIMTGEGLEALYHAFHSKIVTFIFKQFYAGGGLGSDGYRYKKSFFENLPIPRGILSLNINAISIEQELFMLYQLERDEINYIEQQ